MKTAPRILIVDDDAQVLGLFMRMLSRVGYTVTGTISGDEALGMVQAQEFDAMVLDLNMPRPDGFEILKAARQHPRLKIIVVSGFIDGVLLKAAELFGATVALEKPVDPETLLDAVSKMLNSVTTAAAL